MYKKTINLNTIDNKSNKNIIIDNNKKYNLNIKISPSKSKKKKFN